MEGMIDAPAVNDTAEFARLSDAELAAWLTEEFIWAVTHVRCRTGSERHQRKACNFIVAAAKEAARRLQGGPHDALKRLDRWFDTDPEILAAMDEATRADHARQVAMIRAAIGKAEAAN